MKPAVTMADIRKAQGDVCSAAIEFDAEWEDHSLFDDPVWKAASKVARAARRLWRLSRRYAKARKHDSEKRP